MDANAAPEPPPPKPVDVAAAASVLRPALVLWLLSQVAYGGYAQLTALFWHPDSDARAWLLVYEAGYLVLCGVVLAFVWRDADARRVFVRPRPRVVELCLLVGIVTALVLSMWERGLPSWDGSSPMATERGAGWPVWASLLASAVLPALFEEWMYRGLLLTRFLRVLPTGLAIALQAMLFAAMHFDHVMLLPHFVFGVVAGAMRIVAGGLWPCMLMHFLWNGYIVLLVYELL